MRILFTNAGLRNRAGTELWVRDAALGLQRRGHTAAAYSTVLGPVADVLQAWGIVVVDRLEALPWEPDVIHGHHHAETMTALVHFGTVPAVYVCHGVAPWQEAAPRHPRLLRYGAVSELTRSTSINRHGVPPERIAVLPNFVDLVEFPERGPLPERPQRALLFGNQATPEFIYPEAAAGCQRAGVALDAVGRGMGRVIERPGDLLGRYDIVFATGRSALEALVCGAAVILCGPDGLGPLVTADSLDRLRRQNFALAAIDTPLTPEAVAARIERYDAADAARVTAGVRAEAGLDEAVSRLLAMYEGAIAEFRADPGLARPPDPAAAAYIASLALLARRTQREANRRAREGGSPQG